MYIEYAENARMSQTGSSLLRALQNNYMPVLDLLVRESIQNSLDAADSTKPYVKIDFDIGKFHTVKLASQLEGITDKLTDRYSDEQVFVSIRDSNTVGLTGPVTYDDVVDNDYGNLIKLIYEISKPQSKEGAGGSWGLGKTVYFRAGIGLVIYYSRIKLSNGKYESRLAACLVEDEKKKTALLKRRGRNIERGIAWWGDKKFGKKETFPITDESKIKNFLTIFGMRPYRNDETGNTIIIPYIDEDKLLNELVPSDENTKYHIKPFWTMNIENYLKLSVQKWYHPRINNIKYKYGKYMEVAVNRSPICYEDFYPCFMIMQDLYNAASLEEKVIRSHPGIEVNTKTINLRNVFSDSQIAGVLAHVEISDAELRMLPPDNLPDPYTFICMNNEDTSQNPLIMSFTRKTGMAISYEIMGPWTDNVPRSEKGKYVFAFFVLNSDNKLKVGDMPYSLEEYIRQGELADHTSWGDWTLSSGNPNIVTKLQSHVRKALKDSYRNEETVTPTIQDKGMGREFAKFLLPPTGYGKGSSIVDPIRKKDGATKRIKKNHIEIDPRPVFKDGDIIFNFQLDIPKYRTPIEISLKAVTEKMGLKADDWENEDNIGNEFPVKMKKMVVDSLKVNNTEVVNHEVTKSDNKLFSINYLTTKKYSQTYGARVHVTATESEPPHVTILGKLICASTDTQLRVGIDLEEAVNNG